MSRSYWSGWAYIGFPFVCSPDPDTPDGVPGRHCRGSVPSGLGRLGHGVIQRKCTVLMLAS